MIDFAGHLAITAGGLLGVLIAAFIMTRNDKKIVIGALNPRPRFRPPGASKDELRARAAYVQRQEEELRQIPWGQQTFSDRQEAERRYHEALNTIFVAEGDYNKLAPAVGQLQELPLDLAFSGVARIIMTLAYFRGTAFSPVGIQKALTYTSRAVQSNPQSVDAWVMRLWVAAASPTRPYRLIAEHALSRAQALAPNYPYLPDAEAMYYERQARRKEYEAALRRMIELAPTGVVKRAGYDRLALFYADRGRLDEAIDLFQQMVREFPEGSAWSWHNYSLVLLRAKRYQEALAASDRALSFFEFGVARTVNNEARKQLGML